MFRSPRVGSSAISFNYYRQRLGVDPELVKVTNTEGTQYTIESLPAGAVVAISVSGVNDAGEGPATKPVNVTMT